MKKIPFFEIGNEEIKDKPEVGTHIICKMCGEKHKIEYGEEENKDGTWTPSKLLAFYKCKSKSYLAGFAGKDIR